MKACWLASEDANGDSRTTVSRPTGHAAGLALADNPIPTRLYKAKGYWWVDAAPVIAGRKAAAKYSRGERKSQPNDSPDGT